MKRIASLVLMALSALAVSACGLQGNLERPPPMWGDAPEEEQAEGDEG